MGIYFLSRVGERRRRRSSQGRRAQAYEKFATDTASSLKAKEEALADKKFEKAGIQELSGIQEQTLHVTSCAYDCSARRV